jgi:hypothetical protein
MRCLPGVLWAFPRTRAAGALLRRARPGGLGSDRPAFRPATGLARVMERLRGAYCGRSLLQGFTTVHPAHSVRPLQEKAASLLFPLPLMHHHFGWLKMAASGIKIDRPGLENGRGEAQNDLFLLLFLLRV